MCLLAILTTVLVLLVIFAAIAISIGGAVFTFIFADLIVCILVLAWFIRRLIIKRKK